MTEYGSEKPIDLQKIADAPRYVVRRLINRQEAEAVAAEALAAKQRVLWVVNKVRVAQEVARQFGTVETSEGLQTADGEPVLCYHSRFTLDDRKRWHGCVVDAFKRTEDGSARAVLAVTTQVCEMSLDLDADVAHHRRGPDHRAIQRMGRCNRKNGMPATVGKVYVYPPEDPERPYAVEDLTGVPASWRNPGRATSQSGFLEEALRITAQAAPG